MLTKAFNCPDCKKPYDCKDGEPKTPVYSHSARRMRCRGCGPTRFSAPQRGLMEFLDQPAFKKTDDGYEYNAAFHDPICFGCDQTISVLKGCSAFPVKCGHFLCEGCYHKGIDESNIFCLKCNVMDVGSRLHPADARLLTFREEIKQTGFKDQLHAPNKAEKTRKSANPAPDVHVVKAKKARRDDTRIECGDCGKQHKIENLLQCHDHKTIICGICFFESHREHFVVKLLGTELAQLEKQNDKKYTETVEGLHGNLQHLQKNIDNAVDKVLSAGKNRLATITKCGKYDDAQKVVSRVEDAANKFEKHCEVYIPVARELATRLEELSEELVHEAK